MRAPLTLHTFPRAILHIDGDAFFASCEQSRRPALRGRPVVTGKERGIAASMSYEAKARGVTRGMRLADIRTRCPDAVILLSDYETYSLLSTRFFAIVRRDTPDVEEYSIDECFADLTGLRRPLRMSYLQIAEQIKKDLDTALGFTFSVGLAPNKVVAKIASKWQKPSGLTAIPGRDSTTTSHSSPSKTSGASDHKPRRSSTSTASPPRCTLRRSLSHGSRNTSPNPSRRSGRNSTGHSSSNSPPSSTRLNETIEVLLKQRAFRFLSILSPGAVTNPDMAARRATALAIGAQRQSDLLIPIIAEAFDEKAIDTRTRQLVPLRFDESWQTGLDKLLQSLEAAHCPRAEGGARIALRAFFPADVLATTPEKLLANRFPVQVPEGIHRFTSEQNIDTTVNPLMELSWVFRQVNPVTFLSFHDPPDDLRAKWKLNPAGGAVWTHKPNFDGIVTRNLVPELVRKALNVACISRGLAFCPEKRELYFPTGTLPSDRLYFNKPDGSRSYVATGGKRTFWRPGLSSEYRYFLVPVFYVEWTSSEELAVITRLRLRFTDVNGVLLKLRTAVSRRKHLCHDWWNDDWLHRILAIMQHLGRDGDIRISDLPSNTIIIGVQPPEWVVPIGINEDALAQTDAARQEILIETLDSDDDDDESEESDSSD